jgi:hypothetical protein
LQALELRGNTITLTAEEAAGCRAEGGCSLISEKLRLEILAVLAQLAADLEAKICRRQGT